MTEWRYDSAADVYISDAGEVGLPGDDGEIQAVDLATIQHEAPLRFWQLLRAGQREIVTGGPLAKRWAALLKRWSPAADQVEPSAEEIRGLDPVSEAENERLRLEAAYRQAFGKKPGADLTTRAIRREIRKHEEAGHES